MISLDEKKIKENRHDLKLFLSMLLSIANNHQTQNNFYEKIKKVFLILKDPIRQNFTNQELFYKFKRNKQITYF